MELEYRQLHSVTLRADGAEDVSIKGYAAVFNSRSTDLGGFTETIRPGAFAETLASDRNVRLLVNHDGMPLASTRGGTLSLAEDDHGLRMATDLDRSDPDVQSLVPKMKRGDVSGMSFGFRVLGDEWSSDYTEREITKIELHEVSIVGAPAYEGTSVALRSREAAMEAGEVQKRVAATMEASAREKRLADARARG